ncbi:MAG: 4Fe-4S dicluster domain-containing protein [candidate division NC10 bacterium]|nr:4Fe-4S dicluster domain-containing protein [candidate division NC10 bacterium]
MGTFVIDGKEYQADESKTVLEVARANGIEIPTLCYHKSLPPYGACRLCLVEVIWGQRSRLYTACTYPAWEGMVVYSASEKVLRARRLILELLLAEAPASPEIRALAERYGVKETRFKGKRKGEENRCILCGLCTRICQDVLGVAAIGFKGRGDKREVATPFDRLSGICTTCGSCALVCPTGAIRLDAISKYAPQPIPSEFDTGLVSRPCIYIPFPQAAPNKPVIDRSNCMHFKLGSCTICQDACPADAIDYSQQDEIVEEEVGAIVVATGFDLLSEECYGEYGYGKYPDVISSLQFERILSASGPTGGEVKRPSDGKVAETVVFIQCVGSRDLSKEISYCSKICCMYTAKHTMLYKHKVHHGQAYVFYIDIRSGGKNYEEFVRRAVEEDGAIYLRGRVSRIFARNGKLVVRGADTISGASVEIEADLVVLATAMTAQPGIEKLAQKLGVSYDQYKFLSEAHPKLRPVETNSAGIFLAGACQAPKDIPEAVAQGSAAASKVLGLFSPEELTREPIVAVVDEESCVGCFYCQMVCPYGAVEVKEMRDRNGNLIKRVASVNKGVCQGCGACVATCRSNSIDLQGFMDEQIYAEINAL